MNYSNTTIVNDTTKQINSFNIALAVKESEDLMTQWKKEERKNKFLNILVMLDSDDLEFDFAKCHELGFEGGEVIIMDKEENAYYVFNFSPANFKAFIENQESLIEDYGIEKDIENLEENGIDAFFSNLDFDCINEFICKFFIQTNLAKNQAFRMVKRFVDSSLSFHEAKTTTQRIETIETIWKNMLNNSTATQKEMIAIKKAA